MGFVITSAARDRAGVGTFRGRATTEGTRDEGALAEATIRGALVLADIMTVVGAIWTGEGKMAR